MTLDIRRPQWRMEWFMSAASDGNVYALNASTGAKLWSYAAGWRRVFAYLARRGEWGGLYRLARRPRICAERQHRRQAVELCHGRRIVILACGGEWGGLYRLRDNNVYALNASTGAKLWSYATGSLRGLLARGGEWGGLCWLRRRQRVCAECQHRRQAVELCHRRRLCNPRPP